ncbi:hypothetical protein ES702_04672 [subsurface metagenome]
MDSEKVWSYNDTTKDTLCRRSANLFWFGRRDFQGKLFRGIEMTDLIVTEQCHVGSTSNRDPEGEPSTFETKVWLFRPKLAEETHFECCSDTLAGS